ncbi:hypothetical protein [Rhodococcus opacus]|uniref:restriction system modified-DNA reader domain-containing protein n=1 Tax=Rhodococcus opacus TaxID=37919 RepID=UPI001F583EF8|nr:hypothetical protein [Rhodococcus opacus]UNN05196.1 hypothetical protein MOO23_40510 [Rhodococcus opacus]
MGRKIEIDDEVYHVLEQNVRGFEQPNDVLRRLLIAGDVDSGAPNAEELSHRGRLAPLLDSGLVAIGDELRHERVRKGQVCTAVIASGGQIQTPRGIYSAPSPALKDLVGSEIDGWHNWTHTRSGKSLRELRNSLK